MSDTVQLSESVRVIPYIGPVMERALADMDIHTVADLRDRDPMAMYHEMARRDPSGYLDRCVLYVLRSAIYVASCDDPEPDRIDWWTWKGDRSLDRSDDPEGDPR